MKHSFLCVFVLILILAVSGCSISRSTTAIPLQPLPTDNTAAPPSKTQLSPAESSLQIEKNIEAMAEAIVDLKKLDPQKSMSSNPYNFTKDSQYYNNIVSLGTDALVPIKSIINKSDKNGLKEYILAIAGEEIAKVDLKGKNFKWVNGKEWSREWDNHLRKLPDAIEVITIAKTSSEIKTKSLIELGIPAVPYIMDKIEQGNTNLIPALDELLKGNKKVTFEKNEIRDYVEWVKENKKQFEDLREMVEAMRKDK